MECIIIKQLALYPDYGFSKDGTVINLKFNSPVSPRRIESLTGVSDKTVGQIKYRKQWKNISKNYTWNINESH